ncbi:hydantoinase/oxoprolinase N-terminal domain-containing protein [Thiolinea disciformis]|uniref:hydantoinase/oxoprolinase N-terminal domain-containing protein n=1 Tax=Thiolinea disciformis TaxID=125614 RepID=UPI00037D3D2C|nr:hydantoinase/oxoprolinase family protein [Thiolinea disciformis]
MAYHIGIDTGGTYTDAVILQPKTRDIIASAKALTTKGQLSIGIIEALEKVFAAAPNVSASDIALVSLSTTLATNALVEGQGAAIAVVLIGFDATMVERTELHHALPQTPIIRVQGGHRYDGEEAHPLDENALLRALEALPSSIQAYVVASVYSVRNPAHEQRAKQLIRQKTNKPVTASYELSAALNGPRRALTAAFNARIIHLIVALVEAVQTVMEAKGIAAPLMVVKGDGSMAKADSVMEKPIETILSGPAASVIGASFLSGLNDFLISDIGGTTTDVATVLQGWPALNQKGAMVGQYRTMVQAIDMQTIGLGGDSEIEITHDGRVLLKANRIVPVSLIGAKWPSVQASLEHELSEARGLGIASLFVMRPQAYQTLSIPEDLNAAELALLNDLSDEPQAWSRVVGSVRDRLRLKRLYERGLVQIAGFTPSDAAHVLGLQTQWSKRVAELACLMVGRAHGKISFNEQKQEAESQAFARDIIHALVTKSTQLLFSHLAGVAFAAEDELVSRVAQGKRQLGHLHLAFKPDLPLVAVGGPAPVFYPEIGQRLACETHIPRFSDVANAVGAAVGLIKTQVQVSITKAEPDGYHLHGLGEPHYCATPVLALQQAQELAQAAALAQLEKHGGKLSEQQAKILECVQIPDFQQYDGLISAKILAECWGRLN